MMTSIRAPKCLSRRIFYSVAALTLLFTTFCHGVGLIEDERLEEYHARNYTWPPTYKPSTEGWKKLMDRRFTQIAHMKSRDARYEGYVQQVNAAYVVPNFTETGWGLTRAPEELVEELRTAVREGLEKRRAEGFVDVLEGGGTSFIPRFDLMKKVLRDLKPMHEKWAGVPLVGNNAYGFRLYHNQTALHMHVDRPETHIISSILHVDRSDDAEPWPVLIEDYQGNTHEVILESGDMLFYESSKNFHGRPKKFVGSWYTSVFTHYYPVGWNRKGRKLESHYGVPPHWFVDLEEGKPDPFESLGDYTYDKKDSMQMVGTAMKELECPDSWCAFDKTVKWYGPAPKDRVITTGDSTSLKEEL